ncbi:TetR/AcrR family transcriptional regulator [Nocardia sp. XZ_19_385]|uniref:TetR/AcrR family transcriptional regulator n=1 Tax=Nocardia sp. XZ_19_385 TaxID=2769488 RepID=UPI0018907A41|nr:TetR/AcrR family transcriptional regulator [Nocardia sp. XZ_19_385]
MSSTRREHILDAARELIVRDGYASVSMHAIARAAGLTRPAVYAEFSDRDGLFDALLDREEERALLMASAAIPEAEPGADPAEIALRATDIFLDVVLEAPETWRFVLMPGEGMPRAAYERVAGGRAALRVRTQAMLGIVAAMGDTEIDAELFSYAVISAAETAARLVLAEDGPQRRDAVASTLHWLTRRAVASTGLGRG